MSNLSQKKRDEMIRYLNHLKEIHIDDESIIALEKIETALTEKKYGLIWEEHEEEVDKKLVHNIPVFREVEERKIVADENIDFNFLLEGDNLHSLKLLEKTHRGKIDVIYIDPPYNTGNKDFIYDDDYVGTDDGYRHSKWLSFMSERLKIAKELLSEEGVIFISIDDNEYAQLKLLCDHIFGENNFINNVKVKSSEVSGVKMKHVSKRLVKLTEFILIYKKNKVEIIPIKIPKEKWDNEYNKVLLNFSIKDKMIIDDIIENSDSYSLEEYCDKITEIDSILKKCEISSISEVTKKEGIDNVKLNEWKYKNSFRIFRTAASNSVFKLSEEKKKYNKNLLFSVLSSRDKKFYIVKTDYNETSKSPRVQVLFAEDYLEEYIGDSWSDISTTGLEVEGNIKFKNGKKPLSLIERIIKMLPNKKATVLDFFAGSGTTGHAVMQLNKEDGGNRKYILCTNNENGICEKITYQRMKNIQDELPHNLKYYKTEFIPKLSEDEDILSSKLLDYIKEMVELENMCEIDGSVRRIILSDEDLNIALSEMKEGSTLYIPSFILVTNEIKEKIDAKGLDVITIPDYYFADELREVSEL